jgi:CMP-N,N'-diacetyllegionaminic acid synthase
MSTAAVRASCIATICARGGSKGLPNKNILPFDGKPLIVHSIEQALACPEISNVYVSTDDQRIAFIAKEEGALVPFLRPAELATDQAAKLPVIEHLVSHLHSRGIEPQRIIDLQPTSPLRRSQDISAALNVDLAADLVVSVCEARDNPYFNLAEEREGGFITLSKPTSAARRQDVPAVYALNGSIYVWQRAALARAAAHGLWSVGVKPFVMPRWQSVDIDDAEDFEYALWKLKRQRESGRAI